MTASFQYKPEPLTQVTRENRIREQAQDDGFHGGVHAGRESYRKGGYQTCPLQADEYRDTYAKLTEYRTFAAGISICFDDIEHEYEVQLILKKWYGQRVFTKTYGSLSEAYALFQRWVDVFGEIKPFICQVDY